MKICIIAEGSYPYTVGGVSSWIQMLIHNFPETEFVIQTIVPGRESAGQFKYDIPQNVTQINETFLVDRDAVRRTYKKYKMPASFRDAVYSLVFGENVNWAELFTYFTENRKHISINALLTGIDFYDIAREYYDKTQPHIVFSDFLWTLRSIYLPVFLILKSKLIPADGYHAISTGYAGILASCAKHLYKKPLILSEHGIYTREREEEIIKATWVNGVYKDVWIKHFYKMSHCAYSYSDKVVSLFDSARELEIEIGCPSEKTMVIANGIQYDDFKSIQHIKTENTVNVCAILRIAPIKDVKTLLMGYHFAKKEDDRLRLYLLGPYEEDDPYYKEFLAQIKMFGIKDVEFTGRVDLKNHLGNMDINILTSVSEGQPLALMEAMAAGIPSVCTQVGNCEEILVGNSEQFAPCGIMVPVMNVNKISGALLTLSQKEDLRKSMGEAAQIRVDKLYRLEYCIQKYKDLYAEVY